MHAASDGNTTLPLQALLMQDPGLTRQLEAALPAGTKVGSNATLAAGSGQLAVGVHVQNASAELDEEVIDKRSASMLLG